MNRRSFLKMLASAAPVATVAPTYFFAPPGGWLASPQVDPRLSQYQSMLLRFCEQMTRSVPEHENQYIFHPAQRKAAEALMFDGLIWSTPPSDPESFDFVPLTYGGIDRAPIEPINQRMNKACALTDDFARRCGAEWTDKQWT